MLLQVLQGGVIVTVLLRLSRIRIFLLRIQKLFSVTDTDEQTRLCYSIKKYKQKKIDLDAVNNISKFVDGVEWFMVAPLRR
jgi:hypothetical protein